MNEQVSVPTASLGKDLVMSSDGMGNIPVPHNLGQVVEFAQVMCKADKAIPKFLRENPGGCMAVAMRAFRWEMDPFAVADKCYEVNDRLAYEAQLIAAVINRHAPLKEKASIEFTGKGSDLV